MAAPAAPVEAFHPDFYVAVATVMPIFLVATNLWLTGLERIGGTMRRMRHGRAGVLLVLGYLLSNGITEGVAVVVLFARSTAGGLTNAIVLYGFLLSLFFTTFSAALTIVNSARTRKFMSGQ